MQLITCGCDIYRRKDIQIGKRNWLWKHSHYMRKWVMQYINGTGS